MTPKRVQMTKVRDMATISHLRKVTPVNTVSKPNIVPPQLRPAIEQKQAQAAEFREIVLMAIESLAHPVTVAEVQKYVGMELNREFNQPRIRAAFDALLQEGRLVSRLETKKERELRFGGQRPIASQAILYYPTSLGSEVPPRTKTVVVDGATLTGRGNWSTGTKRSKAKRSAARGISQPAGSLTGLPNMDAINILIEKVVEARHADLIKELNETKAQLEKVKSILS